MKFRFKTLMIATIAVLAACGNGVSKSSPSSSQPAPSTTESSPDCSKASIEKGVGESVSYFECSGSWAALTPGSSDNCGECESVLLYEWSNNGWNLRANCNQYDPIVDESSCEAAQGAASNMTYLDQWADFPPKEVLCTIWPANRDPSNVAQTGCN